MHGRKVTARAESAALARDSNQPQVEGEGPIAREFDCNHVLAALEQFDSARLQQRFDGPVSGGRGVQDSLGIQIDHCLTGEVRLDDKPRVL